MTIPIKWAPGDKAVVRVTVDRSVDADGDIRIEVDDGSDRGARVYVHASKLMPPPLVTDDPRVVELIAAARAVAALQPGVGAKNAIEANRWSTLYVALSALEDRT